MKEHKNIFELDWTSVVAVLLLVAMILAAVIYGYNCAAPEEEVTDTQEEAALVVDTAYKYNVTDEEVDLLARMVFFESSVCGDECQRAIASVAINQWFAGYWGHDLAAILTNSNIYSTAKQTLHSDMQPTSREYDNVIYVLTYGTTIEPDVCYFRAGHDFAWDGYENVAVMDNVYFGHFINGNHWEGLGHDF